MESVAATDEFVAVFNGRSADYLTYFNDLLAFWNEPWEVWAVAAEDRPFYEGRAYSARLVWELLPTYAIAKLTQVPGQMGRSRGSSWGGRDGRWLRLDAILETRKSSWTSSKLPCPLRNKNQPWGLVALPQRLVG